MQDRKKIILICTSLILALVLICVILTQCTKKEEISKDIKTIDVGNIKAVCPDGWVNYPVYDAWADDKDAIDPDIICFVKSDTEECDTQSYPSITITYYGEDNVNFDMRSLYSNVEEISIDIADNKWIGFVGEYAGHTNGVLMIDGNSQIGVSGYLQAENGSFAFTDDDVKKILESITINIQE